LEEILNTSRIVDLSLTGIFGALIAISYLVPIGAMIGGTSIFSLSWIVETITGILLGPYYGGGAGLLGGIVGNLFKPSPFLPFAIFLPAIAALVSGLIVWNLWPIAAIVLAALISLWFLMPVPGTPWPSELFVSSVWPAALFHIFALVIIVFLGWKLAKVVRQGKGTYYLLVGVAWMLIAYCGDITRHVLGNILSVAVFSLPPAGFLLVIPDTLVEQTMYAFFSAIIGVPLLYAIRTANLEIPLTRSVGAGKLPEE
jgi:hypothetical protein